MPQVRIRVGVLGTSWWADAMYLPALAGHPDAEVVAVCGRQPSPTEAFARRWAIPAWFTDPATMFADAPLDAVIIATANDSHHDLANAAIDRGLHVLCEKPLALNADQAAVMTERADAAGVVTMVPFTYHHMPMNRWVQRLIGDGYVGRPLHANLRYYAGFGFGTGYSWRFDRDVAGSGIIGDLGSHFIHLARWLLGDVEQSVSAVASTFIDRDARPAGGEYERLEDSAVMTVRYRSGAYGVIQTSAVCWEGTPFGQTHHLEVHGDAGTITATCDWDTVQEVRGLRAGDTGGAKVLPIPDDIWAGVRRGSVHDTYRDVFRTTDAMTRGWIAAIRDRRVVEADFAEGLAVQRVVDAAVRSAARGGAPMTVPWARQPGLAVRYPPTALVARPDVHVLAIDHRWQMEEMVDAASADRQRIVALKHLLFQAFERVAAHRTDVGILLDDQYGSDLLERMTGSGRWLARAVDRPRSLPVEFMGGPAIEATLRSWPPDHIAKLMVYAHPDDPADVADVQWLRMIQFANAARAADRSFLVEFQAPAGRTPGAGYLPRMLAAAYEHGVAPDWWKLPPVADRQQWADAAAVIAACDPLCEGMLVLGQTADPEALATALAAASAEAGVRGFAIGRAIFGPAARSWLTGEIDDGELVATVAERFEATIEAWAQNRLHVRNRP